MPDPRSVEIVNRLRNAASLVAPTARSVRFEKSFILLLQLETRRLYRKAKLNAGAAAAGGGGGGAGQ